MTSTRIMPPPVVRRLLLAMAGWRWTAGVWTLSDACLTDEQVDTLSPAGWQACLGLAVVSAGAMP